MTKDGKPSRINDIRLFYSPENPLKIKAAHYLDGHEEAKAFAQRMTWWLNGEEYSCGSWPALYLVFSPTLKPGEIKITNESSEWWHRYVLAGVPAGFPGAANSSDVVKRAIVEALRVIRSDLYRTVNEAERMVRTHGSDLRFLMQMRKTKRSVIELYFSLPVPPHSAQLFTGFTDAKTGVFLEAPPLDTGVSGAPFEYNGTPLTIAEIEKMTDVLRPKKRPIMSKMVKNRG